MISTTNYSPSFGKLHVLPDYQQLGVQGQRSLTIVKPFLEDISQDCHMFLGALPNIEKNGKPTLAVISKTLEDSIKGLGLNIKQLMTPRPYSIWQSSTVATSPRSLYTNAVMAKTKLLVKTNKSETAFNQQVEAFLQNPKMKEALDAYDKSFTLVPTENDLVRDTFCGESTAKRNLSALSEFLR